MWIWWLACWSGGVVAGDIDGWYVYLTLSTFSSHRAMDVDDLTEY